MLGNGPTRCRRKHRQKCRQHHQRHAYSINSEQILDAEGLNPRQLNYRLHVRFTQHESNAACGHTSRQRKPHREHEHYCRSRQRNPANQILSLSGDNWQCDDQRNACWQENKQREGEQCGLIHEHFFRRVSRGVSRRWSNSKACLPERITQSCQSQ